MGINNVKDFLEALAYLIAIIVGIQEIYLKWKGKWFPFFHTDYFILHSRVMQGGLIAVILILYIVLKRRRG